MSMNSKGLTHLFVRSLQPVPNSPEPMQKVRAFRLSDGILVATANDALVGFGEDPQRQTMRVFLDHSWAVKFLRDLMDRDWAVQCGVDPSKPDFMDTVRSGYVANIQEDDAEKRIVPADQRQVLQFKH